LLDGQVYYNFNIVDFENYQAMEKVGDNLYSGENPIESQAVVKQNSLEKSNVNIINEMVNMMTVMRTFESNQKVVQSIDETLSKAVNEIGTVR
jgi:flagellar basal-body rod protein FlgG